MCGKFTQRNAWRELVLLSGIATVAAGEDADVETVTPMRFARVVALDGDGKRRSVPMRWGLIPAYARDPKQAKPHIHARAETIDSKPTFRESFLERRGLVLVTTFNEGEEVGARTVQHVCTPKDGKHVAITSPLWGGRSAKRFGWGSAPSASTDPPGKLFARSKFSDLPTSGRLFGHSRFAIAVASGDG